MSPPGEFPIDSHYGPMEQDASVEAGSGEAQNMASIISHPLQQGIQPQPQELTNYYSLSDVFTFDRTHNQASADIVLYSSDMRLFYAHSTVLAASENEFGGRIPRQTTTSQREPLVLYLSEHSEILHAMLCSVYKLMLPNASTPFKSLLALVECLHRYGLLPETSIRPGSHLFNLLATYASQHPLELYTIAAEQDNYALAAAASIHLLETPLLSIPAHMLDRIGGVYVKRLGLLQLRRVSALKSVLLPGPVTHPVLRGCTSEMQQDLARSYALAAAYLIWEDKADIPVERIQEVLSRLRQDVTCTLCKDLLAHRVTEVVSSWLNVSRSI